MPGRPAGSANGAPRLPGAGPHRNPGPAKPGLTCRSSDGTAQASASQVCKLRRLDIRRIVTLGDTCRGLGCLVIGHCSSIALGDAGEQEVITPEDNIRSRLESSV